MDRLVVMEDIIRYNATEQKLTGSQLDKALKFVRSNLVKQIGELKYMVLPIKDYNSTAYMTYFRDGWHCNCQHHNRTGKICSHIIATYIYIKYGYDIPDKKDIDLSKFNWGN
jgi:hypothetical protein